MEENFNTKGFFDPTPLYKEHMPTDTKLWFNLDLITWANHKDLSDPKLHAAFDDFCSHYHINYITFNEVVFRLKDYPKEDFNAIAKHCTQNLKNKP